MMPDDAAAAASTALLPALETAPPRRRVVLWLLLCAVAALLRGGTLLNSHSGRGAPPLHGDFEAQRHWMELTLALPPGEWYTNTTRNDLLYWGLDYPPLTAYVSRAFGVAAQRWCPRLVEWRTSRGYEELDGRAFMRLSVLLSDALVWLPAVALAVSCVPAPTRFASAAALLLHPAIIAIDHGHFQYNAVSLGLSLAAVAAFAHRRWLASAVLFTCALNFKQMTLYYSLVVFVALLHAAVAQSAVVRSRACSGVLGVAALGGAVLLTCALLWWPLCVWTMPGQSCAASLRAMLARQFPFDRSLFEDKVSNLWCALEPLLRFRSRIYADASGQWRARIAAASAIVTLLLSLPPLALLWRRLSAAAAAAAHTPSGKRALLTPFDATCLALFAVSSAFFLASYQVHEKTILIVLLPLTCLYGRLPLLSTWFALLSVVSMWPLLVKDGLVVASACLSIVYALALWPSRSDTEAHEVAELLATWPRAVPTPSLALLNAALRTAACVSIAMGVALMAASFVVPPPAGLPDLFPFVSSAWCAAWFLAAMALAWLLLSDHHHACDAPAHADAAAAVRAATAAALAPAAITDASPTAHAASTLRRRRTSR